MAPEKPELPAAPHLVLSPPEDCTAGDDAECLLVVVPGGGLAPGAFESLCRATQAAATGLRLWAAVLNINHFQLFAEYGGGDAMAKGKSGFLHATAAMLEARVQERLIMQAVDQAAEQGFRPRRDEPDGVRISNLVLVCQSVGGLGYPQPSRHLAGGLVFLGSSPCTGEMQDRKVASIEPWPCPMMILNGELDGQMRWQHQVPYVGELAAMAAKMGAGYASRTKPVIVVPGVNHGNTSNGVANWPRGDPTCCVHEYDKSVQALAAHISDFLTVHLAPQEEQQQQAEERLVTAVRQTLITIAPYCTALGLGDVAAPFDSSLGHVPAADRPGSVVAAAGLLPNACRSAVGANSYAIHPGVVAACEEAAVAAQRAVLREAGLPADEVEARVVVAATAHTLLDTFAHTAPSMTPLGGGRWLLHVHVLLHYRSTDPAPPGSPIPVMRPHAPELWLMLKGAEHVARVLGLPDPSRYPTPPPTTLCRTTLAAAMAAVPREVAQRYEQYGRKVEIGDDLDGLASLPAGSSPPSCLEPWIRDSRIAFIYPATEGSTAAAAAPGTPLPPAPPPSPAASLAPPTPPAPAAPGAPPVGPGTTPSGATPANAPRPDGAPAGAPPATGASQGGAPGARPPGPPMGPPPPPPPGPPSALPPVRLGCPYLLLPDVGGKGGAGGAGRERFAGSYYVKVPSVAQLMEWVWLDCLRTMDTPW